MLCCHFRRLLAQLGVGEHQREFQASSGSFGWGLEGFTVVCLSGNALLLLGLPQGGWKVVYWAVVPPTHTHTYTQTDRQTDTKGCRQTQGETDRHTTTNRKGRATPPVRALPHKACAPVHKDNKIPSRSPFAGLTCSYTCHRRRPVLAAAFQRRRSGLAPVAAR